MTWIRVRGPTRPAWHDGSMLRGRIERLSPDLALASYRALALVLLAAGLCVGCARPIRSGRIVPGLEGREMRTILAADLEPCAFPVSTWEMWFTPGSKKTCAAGCSTCV